MLRPKSLASLSRIVVSATGDGLIACGAVALVVAIRVRVDLPLTRELLPPGKFPLSTVNLLVFALSLVAALALSGFYDFRASPRHRPTLLVALPLQLGLVAVAGTLLEISWPRTVFVAVPFIEAAVLPWWRRIVAVAWKERGARTVLIGEAASLRDALPRLPDWLVLEGLVSLDERIDHPKFAGLLGDPEAGAAIVEAEELIDLGAPDGGERRLTLLGLRGPRGFLCAPDTADALLTSRPFGSWGDQLLVQVSAPGAYGVGALVKRSMDLVLGALLLVLASPLLAVVAVLVAIDGRGPVLLRQRRAGLRGETFGMWKFRTMHAGDAGNSPAQDDDARVTRVGRWLRRYRFDELPQLVNVVAGTMSLVGPRPEIPERAEEIAAFVPHFHLRLLVRPGLAGLAQVSAEYDQAPGVKLMHDLQYVCRWSPALDVSILFRAVATALSGRGV
jgi:lipopolysaccharide/colanic/teichoic acid biosynthesis glycosyltransferase